MKHLKYMILLCLFCLTGIAVQAQSGPADNEIWYTATAKLPETAGTGTTTGLHCEVFTDADGNVLTMTHTYDEATCKGVVTFNGSIATVGKRAFYNVDLTSVTLPECVTTIGEIAFYKCSGLTSITIPNSVTSINGNAFQKCSGLTSITVESGNTMYDSRDNSNAIIEKANNTLVAGCKNTIIPNSVTSIGDYAFDGCTGLTSIEIPNSVTSIGDNAFYDCSQVTSINFPEGLQSIGDYAFAGCETLTSIKFPASLTTIGRNAFTNAGLTTIDIPKTVTTIGNSAFKCNNLSKLKVHWPEGVDESKIDMNMVFSSHVKNVEYRIPAGSYTQNSTIGLSSYTIIHYLTFRQDPNNKTDYYATFYTNSATGRDKYCYDLTGTGIKAYTGVLEPTDDLDVDVLKLKDAGNIIGQGIAVVLKYTAGDDLGPTIDIDIPTSSETAQTVEQNDLTGTDINLYWNGEEERKIPDNTYVLTASVPDGVIGFYPWNGNGKTIDAHKAYITLDGTNGGTKVVKCVFEK